MIRLVDSLADMTSVRDRDELEIIVARAAASVVAASKVKLWRIVGDAADLRLHERALLLDRITTVFDIPQDFHDLPRLETHRELLASYADNATVPVEPDADGQRRHIFPVIDAKGASDLLDLYIATALRNSQARLVSGLLRIYQNHLKVLDYGERDELTGLQNRKTFDAAFGRLTQIEAPLRRNASQFERIERRRTIDPLQPRWLAVMDVDFFKRVNDRFGHPCGDAVLASMARLMRTSFRESDQLFRCGGEEFVVILAPTNEQYVRGVLERFRTIVEDHRFPQVGSVTISIGYTRISAVDIGAAAFRRADEALYSAKRQGRNRVICYEEIGPDGVIESGQPADTNALVN